MKLLYTNRKYLCPMCKIGHINKVEGDNTIKPYKKPIEFVCPYCNARFKEMIR